MTLPASGPLAMTDIQTEFGGTNPIGLNEYYAGGGLVPPGTSGTYGAVPSSGALSIQNFYGTSQFIPVYIEELFQTWLYTGNGSTQTITNGIDLAGEGGLVWIKRRNIDAFHQLYDTARGVQQTIYTNSANAQTSKPVGLTAFNANGFTVGSEAGVNGSGDSQVSWTFRKQPKFFDVVTYTGDGVSGRQIAHSLGSAPGCVIVKMLTDSGYSWQVYHRGLTSAAYRVELDTTGAETTSLNPWVSTAPTASVFTVSNSLFVNGSGKQYVAYLFAHNAGGFGLTGTDNVISCGSFTTNGAGNATVNLGYEPQWLLIKRTDTSGPSWLIFDNMRGLTVEGNCVALFPNKSDPDTVQSSVPRPNATGFTTNSWSGSATYIYIAIRRGPMKVPTLGTSVFQPVAYTGTGSTQSITGASFPPSLVIGITRNSGIGYGYSPAFIDSLRGVGPGGQTRQLFSSSTNSELTTTEVTARTMTGITLGSAAGGNWNFSGSTYVAEMFQRAPSFFDEVCYTGTGSAMTVAHNLGVVPELIIVKGRSYVEDWAVYSASLANTQALRLNSVSGFITNSLYWNSTNPTASVFTVGTRVEVNNSGGSIVAYLFATCPGVSKVGSYTGNGSNQTINCGFTGGARFVLIKRTDNSGDWYVWDSARGIVAGNDPYLRLNLEAAEVTSTDYIDTTSVGFEITSTAPAAINANGGTFIFLAIA